MGREFVEVFVEIPQGSRNKYEYDKVRRVFVLDRVLYSSVHYPTDYGFIPDTLGEDGDPLDAMVLVERPTFPGCVIPVRAIAALRMADERGQDDKIICVPLLDPHWSGLERLADIAPQLRTEIEHFFSIYKQPEGIDVDVYGFEDRDKALALIDEARERFNSRSRA